MARQKGTYRIKGKHEGLSYYSVKHGVGDIFRTINEQMSVRVKTAPEYALTRAYAEEFGVATSISQNVIKTLKDFGAKITNQTKVNRLCSRLLEYVHADTTDPIGQRTLTGGAWQDIIRSFVNTLSKKPFDAIYMPNLQIGWRKRVVGGLPFIDFKITCDSIVSDSYLLKNQQISQVRVKVYACRFGAKYYDPSAGQYIPSGYDYAEILNQRIPATSWENPFTHELTITGDRILVEDERNMTCYAIVVTPYRSDFSGIIPMGSLISFKVIRISNIPMSQN